MSIQSLLGIQYPIIQGAMAQISMAPLVAAVSQAGGLGVIASGGLTADQVRDQIRQVKAATDKPFAVNLMLMMHNIAEIVQVVIDEGVPIVTTGAGTPKHVMPHLKAAGIKVVPVVAAVKHAKKMEELGVDAIIAEGCEAGGHVGETNTMALIPQIVDAVNIPVIAAGGIADGRGIAAALALGAQGVQIGTLFLASQECPIPDSYKQAVIDADDTATVVTGRRNGAPVRCIANTMTQEYLALEDEKADRDQLEAITMGALGRAVRDGDVDTGSVMAGQIAGMIKEVKPVAGIIGDLVAETKRCLNHLSTIGL
ncbi:TPA: DUF561 domain-containing protein [Streptococcus suis]